MDNTITGREKKSLAGFFIPAGIVLCFWLFLNLAYHLIGTIDDVSLYRTLAAVICVLLYVSVGFSSLLIYPVMYFNGASFKLRVMGVYIMPLAWCIKEFIRATSGVTLLEGLFYVLFTSLQLWLLIGQVGLIGVSELVCRAIVKRKNASIKIVTPGPIIAILISLAATYFIIIWGGGLNFHLMIKMIYVKLFL
ncbi:MAG: hypothetical protein K8S13_03465 [Desulfobacula sp.]|uniref:hypothetical protein n=1 Tax=Desulfobacula sp. TaxID=2593537 RepID=UPI0025B7B75B|nr:hypothetical protein [Desulfobacula sp.]MCD4718902.1 hypothetical protein [Desulfobacula sp.]